MRKKLNYEMKMNWKQNGISRRVENVMCVKSTNKRRQEIDSVAVGSDYQNHTPHPNCTNTFAQRTIFYCIVCTSRTSYTSRVGLFHF